jgi:predicted HTH transcriptional regulator
MNFKDIERWIEEGEGFHLEFKRKVSSPEKIARSLIAFANSKGGRMLFGIDDDGSIVGVESEKAEMEEILLAGKYFCDPPIEPTIDIIPHGGKDIIVATIAESFEKPHVLFQNDGNKNSEERIYIRVNDKTVLASKEVAKIMEAETPDAAPLRIVIGQNERNLFEYFDTHERVTVKQFADMVNISNRRASRILVSLVRASILRIHTTEKEDYYTMTEFRSQ